MNISYPYSSITEKNITIGTLNRLRKKKKDGKKKKVIKKSKKKKKWINPS